MRPCEALRDDLKAYIDGELSALRRVTLRAHLARCPACREEVAGMDRISREMRRTDAGELPVALRARLIASIPDMDAVTVAKPTATRRTRLTLAAVAVTGLLAVGIYRRMTDPFQAALGPSAAVPFAQKTMSASRPSAATKEGATVARQSIPLRTAPALVAAAPPPPVAPSASQLQHARAVPSAGRPGAVAAGHSATLADRPMQQFMDAEQAPAGPRYSVGKTGPPAMSLRAGVEAWERDSMAASKETRRGDSGVRRSDQKGGSATTPNVLALESATTPGLTAQDADNLEPNVGARYAKPEQGIAATLAGRGQTDESIVNLKVADLSAKNAAVLRIVTENGGRTDGPTLSQSGDGTRTSTFNVEVPVERAPTVFYRVRQLGEAVTEPSNTVAQKQGAAANNAQGSTFAYGGGRAGGGFQGNANGNVGPAGPAGQADRGGALGGGGRAFGGGFGGFGGAPGAPGSNQQREEEMAKFGTRQGENRRSRDNTVPLARSQHAAQAPVNQPQADQQLRQQKGGLRGAGQRLFDRKDAANRDRAKSYSRLVVILNEKNEKATPKPVARPLATSPAARPKAALPAAERSPRRDRSGPP